MKRNRILVLAVWIFLAVSCGGFLTGCNTFAGLAEGTGIFVEGIGKDLKTGARALQAGNKEIYTEGPVTN